MSFLKRLFAREEKKPVISDWPLHEVLYILRPGDGVRKGRLPTADPGHGEVSYLIHREEGIDDLYVAVCDFCGGNCGQCGTSVGSGVPLDFERIILKSNLWKTNPIPFIVR